MSWIESHQSLANHPKTLKLASLLGIGIPQVIGHLHLLWYWALDYAEDGDITDGADTLNIICQWPGTNDQFRQALVDVKFLDSDLKLHNWPIYTGLLLEKRKQQREAKRLGGLARAEAASRDQQGRYVSPAADQQADQQKTSKTQLTNQPTNRNQPTVTNRQRNIHPPEKLEPSDKEWINVLRQIKDWNSNKENELLAWVQRNGFSEILLEQIANAVVSYWPGPKGKQRKFPHATFRAWILKELNHGRTMEKVIHPSALAKYG